MNPQPDPCYCNACIGVTPEYDDAEYGTCDTCNALYHLGSRDGRCGDCGECELHCPHLVTYCPSCGGTVNLPLPPCIGAGALPNLRFHPRGVARFGRAAVRVEPDTPVTVDDEETVR